MDLTLYRAVGALNRVALGDLCKSEFYTASVDDKGAVTLTPVNIVDGTKRAETPTADPFAEPTDLAPFTPDN